MHDVSLYNRLYTVDQIRKIETQAAKLQFNNDDFVLMQRAGHEAYYKILELNPKIKHITVFCGQGNNGGDGFMVAALAAEHGYEVQVFLIGEKLALSANCQKAYQRFQNIIQEHKNAKLIVCGPEYNFFVASVQEVAVESGTGLDNKPGVEDRVYVDALLGIGLNRAPEGLYKKAIEYINTKKNILALDVPSGLNADTGEIYGACVKANYTQTFIALKPGLFTGDGPDHCGVVYMHNLVIDPKIVSSVDYDIWLLAEDYLKKTIQKYLPRRLKNSHKHQFGHVLIIGGGIGMPGAVIMAGLAAMRVGAGLVTIITHKDHSHDISSAQPELMSYGIDENFDAQSETQDKIIELISKATVVVLGPGLGLNTWAKKIFTYVVEYILHHNQQKRLLVDADGLTLLNELIIAKKYFNLLKTGVLQMVLTPHPGEAKKLLNNTEFHPGKAKKLLDDAKFVENKTAEQKQSRFRIATSISEGYNAITVLKGHGTLVASPNFKTALCPFGNPGMSTAGAGDILAGVIAGLIAQELENYTASCLGVYLHAVAGDSQANKYGERGLIATDLLEEIRRLINS